MKKTITLFSIILSTLLYSQDVYQNGFSAGYTSGYCYNILGCVAPVAPIGFRDIKNDYQTGYNNGFVKGQQDQVSNNTSYNSTGGVKGQLRPSIPDLDLNIDPNLSREMWANYYEKRRIKKENKAVEKNKNNEVLKRIISEKTIEIIKEIESLQNRLHQKNLGKDIIDKTINNLHYENQTLYNTYKDSPENYKKYYKLYKNLLEKISKM